MNFTVIGLDVSNHEAREIAQEFLGVLEARGHDVDGVAPNLRGDDDPDLRSDGGRPAFIRNYEPDPRKVLAEEVAEVDVRSGRVARYRDGCELSLAPGEDAPESCPGEGCHAGLEGVVVPDGGTAQQHRRNTRAGGEGLPPAAEDSDTVELLTCIACGRRWADPIVPVQQCGCGGDVVTHRFEDDAYSRLRWYDDPRSAEVIDDAS